MPPEYSVLQRHVLSEAEHGVLNSLSRYNMYCAHAQLPNKLRPIVSAFGPTQQSGPLAIHGRKGGVPPSRNDTLTEGGGGIFAK